MMAFTEAEYMAIQDLLELDMLLDQSMSDPDAESCSILAKLTPDLIKDHFKRVIAKKIPTIDFPANCEWFNISQPLSRDHLKGRIVLLDFFTYCCINCMHILPDLEALEETFENQDQVLVIGVHSAKFDNERVGNNINNAIQRYGIHHPVINDSGASLWQNWSISCWPTVVLCFDGKPLKFFVGEGHRQNMIDFVQVALEHFKEDLNKAGTRLPLPKMEVGLRLHESPLKFPGKVLVQDGLVFISDTGNHRIIVCHPNGDVKDLIGVGRGHADGTFKEAKFNSPQGLAKKNDFLYVCDTNNHVIRCINLLTKEVTTIAGNGHQCRNSQMTSGQNGLDMALASPWDLVLQGQNELWIAMAGTHQIWSLDLSSMLMTLKAGSGKEENRNNSYPLKSAFAQPSGLALNENNDLYIADSESSTIRVFTKENGVKNVCGGSKNPMDLFSFGDVDGLGTEAKLQHPLGVAYAGDGKLFIADSYNHKLKVVTELKAKNPKCSTCPVQGLDEPGGLCFTNGKLYVADTNNHKIKMVNIDTFETEELVLNLTQNTQEEVDFAKANMILKAKKGHKLQLTLKLKPNFTLNLEAPNSYKIDFPPKSGKSSVKHNLKSDLKVEINAFENDDKEIDFVAITFKLYLCSEGICTVKNQKVMIEFDDQNQSNETDFLIDI